MSDISTTPSGVQSRAEHARTLLRLLEQGDAQSVESNQLFAELFDLQTVEDDPEVDGCLRAALEGLIRRDPEVAFLRVVEYEGAASLAPVVRAELTAAIGAIGTLGWSVRFLALLEIYGLVVEAADASLIDGYATRLREALEGYVPSYDDVSSELVLHELLEVQGELWGGPLPDDLWQRIGGWHETWQARLHRKHARNEPCWCGSGKKYKKCCLRSRPLSELPSWELEPAMRGAWPPSHLFETPSRTL